MTTRCVEERKQIEVVGYTAAEMGCILRKLPPQTHKDAELTLMFLKQNLSWMASPEKNARDRVTNFLNRFNWNMDEEVRSAASNDCPLSKQIVGSVDVFPVMCPQDAEHTRYTGKYKGACLKFELWVTNDGVPFAVYGPYAGAMHDSNVLSTGEKFLHTPHEFFLADKAYIGQPHLIVPRKISKNNPYTDDEKVFVLHHRKHRAQVEHAIGRLHRFRIMWYSAHRPDFTEAAVKFIVWCEHTVGSMRYVGVPRVIRRGLDGHDVCRCAFVSDSKRKAAVRRRAREPEEEE